MIILRGRFSRVCGGRAAVLARLSVAAEGRVLVFVPCLRCRSVERVPERPRSWAGSFPVPAVSAGRSDRSPVLLPPSGLKDEESGPWLWRA